MIALILAAAFSFLLIPLKLHADIHFRERKLLRLSATVCGLRREWLLEAIATPEGHRLIITGKASPPQCIAPQDMHQGISDKLLRRLWELKPLRRFLLEHTHALVLDMQLLLHTGSAAVTALVTGMLHTAVSCMPARWRQTLRLRIMPDFLNERSTLQARCIFRVRLGTLLIAACLLLADQAIQTINREVHSIWNIPSEN